MKFSPLPLTRLPEIKLPGKNVNLYGSILILLSLLFLNHVSVLAQAYSCRYTDSGLSTRCGNNTIFIRITVSNNVNLPIDNLFIAQISDASGNFTELNNYPTAKPNVVGTVSGNQNNGVYYNKNYTVLIT